MEFLEPRTLEEAVRLGAEQGEDARFVAGGTALVLLLQQGLLDVAALVSLRRLADVDGLDRIEVRGNRLRIGAGVPLSLLATSPLVRQHVPELAHSAAVVGNVRVRNAATLCGNVAEADPGSDPPAVLVNRGAEAIVVGPRGERRQPIAEVVTDYYTTTLAAGDVLLAIEVPTGRFDVARYVKFTSRSSEDRPCVGLALGLRVQDGLVDELAVTVGAAEARPRRLDEVTAAAVGRAVADLPAAEIADGCAGALTPLSDARGSATYRRRVSGVLLQRALEELAGTGGAR